MNTSANTNTITTHRSVPARIAAMAFAVMATLTTLHSIDVLASREHGASLMSRTAVQAVTAANSLRGVKRS